MFESLSTFLDSKQSEKEARVWQHDDVKYCIQAYIRSHIKNCEPYCEVIREGVVSIRVNSALFHQEILLLQYDLSQHLWQEGKYKLTTLQVTG